MPSAAFTPKKTHARSQSSMAETFGHIRTRTQSVSKNAHEIAEALKAPVSYKLIVLCIIWYMTSAVTNTSSKSILNALDRPITLTLVQFAFVSLWCLLFASLAHLFPALRRKVPALKNGIRYPTVDVCMTALPLACFSLAGHIFSALSMASIPVSLVHTIKGLSPLFTVFAYRMFFGIRYARKTYLSLVPLTLGVMLACSTGFSTNLYGIFCAFVAAVTFVTQNIFSKRLFNEAARVEAEGPNATSKKLDKLNLLCYCSAIGFVLTAPIWFYFEGYGLLTDFLSDGSIALSGKKGSFDHGELALEYFFNGATHFAQNILAFILLSTISPVSYSVASLIKRVFVIVVSIVWFGNPTTTAQALGIALTFLGLYLYDRCHQADLADRRANADHFHSRKQVLPIHTHNSAAQRASSDGLGYRDLPLRNYKRDEPSSATPTGPAWLPGTKQESTWQAGDAVQRSQDG
ncbi:suppressor of loss of ypt1 [Ascosphaera aggregata]|nr:suppressor of loss of ypt1 [Ascosphaera aggregata]